MAVDSLENIFMYLGGFSQRKFAAFLYIIKWPVIIMIRVFC